MEARKIRKLALATVTSLCAIAAAAPGAQAGLLVPTVTDCPVEIPEKPFLRWHDPATYTLAPGGTLEGGGAGWTLSGASVVSGNETFYVHSGGDSASLSLPPGSSAITAPMCVGLEHPTLRFFARSSSRSLTGALLSSLRVDVVFESLGGVAAAVPIGVVTPTSSWQPTLPMLVVANALPLVPGRHTAVAFRFTPQGSASWRIDDVYVDPKRR
jgi:hypothetical protein